MPWVELSVVVDRVTRRASDCSDYRERNELKVRRILACVLCRLLSIRWEYSPRVVTVTKETQRNGTDRRCGLDANVAFVPGSSVPEFCDAKPIRRIRTSQRSTTTRNGVFRNIQDSHFIRMPQFCLRDVAILDQPQLLMRVWL